MTNYRRNFVAGGTFFFTVNLANRSTSLLTDHIDHLRAAFRYVNARHPFTTDAIVIMPDHLHAILTLPSEDRDFPLRWRLIKTMFSRSVEQSEPVSQSRKDKGERGIWQRRFWEHTIKDEIDYTRHVDYIHFNPVKHGCVSLVSAWPHSSFHRFVRDGILPKDWTGSPKVDVVNFGETTEG